MILELIEPWDPIPFAVDARPTSHLAEPGAVKERATVRFLCGYEAPVALLGPPTDERPCQRCQSAAQGDARIRRLFR